MIKLADSSELGWKVVQEYESNPIADDSEDEKRMNFLESGQLSLQWPLFPKV
jgi:hypothetical protein